MSLVFAPLASYTEMQDQAATHGDMLKSTRQVANTQQCVCKIHWSSAMKHLTRDDYASALEVLARVEAQADNCDSFAHAVVQALSDFVDSERTTLSVCDLMTGQRQTVGAPGGLQYAIALPLFRDHLTRVSIVLNRRGLDFDERDLERLELLRPHLAFMYLHACHARHACKAVAAPKDDTPLPPMQMPPDISAPVLTQREADVMRWLACGKTDAEIAALLAISPRTVQKHLQHIYVKLGVETRTAAVMRALAICEHSRTK
ncbi:MAG: LuxR C-terminal-related transcriptional regulator [Polaromonas sp.]|nr:LuxR C-terminal-related transcriptional regulator [Polaromonas sp.]